MKIINFKDTKVFSQLEDKAIDGQLDYDSFPPREYKYFSRLARLGYLNRHKGWSVETCLIKQEEYKNEYQSETDEGDMYLNLSKRIQNNIKSTSDMIRQIYKSNDYNEILNLTLQVLENLTNENGLKSRILKKLKE